MNFRKTPIEGSLPIRKSRPYGGASTTSAAPVDPASQGTVIKRTSLLLVAVAFLLSLGLAHAPEGLVNWLPKFVPEAIQRILDGLIVAGIAAFLIETHLLKNYFEERLQRLIGKNQSELLVHCEDLIGDDFATRVTNVEYLRQFKNQLLDDAEEAIRRASFAVDLPTEVENFHRSLRDVRNQLDVWRTDYFENLTISAYNGRTDLVELVEEGRWTWANYNDEPRQIPQLFEELSYKLSGVPDDALFRITQLEIDGVDKLPTLKWERRAIGTNQIETLASMDPVTLAPMHGAAGEGVKLRSRAHFIRRRNEPLSMRFIRPVYKFVVSLNCPPDLHPRMIVFGVGSSSPILDPFEPRSHVGNLYQWEWDGWLLPSHGWVLTFTDVDPGMTPASGVPVVTGGSA